MRTFYRNVIQVEILSEEVYDPEKDLDEIYRDITDGECSGDVTVITSNQPLTARTCAELLIEQGSDPGFFGLEALL